MALPNVEINVANGALGQVAPSEDGVAGLLFTGVADDPFALATSYQIFSTDEARALGLDEDYDFANSLNVFKAIKDFYQEAGEGSELWLHGVAKTNTMATICDVANNVAKKLLNDAGGRIKLLAVTRVPDGAYTPVYAGQLDPDVMAAAAKIQGLYAAFKLEFKPFRAFLDGRDFQGTTGSLTNLKASAYNSVAVVLSTDISGSKNAAIGLALGRAAANKVQRKISRVKDGDLGIQAAFFTGQTTDLSTLTTSQLGVAHDLGYIVFRKFPNKNGYFFSGDHTATADSDDYSSFARGRIIDKAIRITQLTYVNEIEDDLETGAGGTLNPAVSKGYQSLITNALNSSFNRPGEDKEVSAIDAFLDPTQNVVSTNTVAVTVRIRPKGYSTDIVVDLGFEL